MSRSLAGQVETGEMGGARAAYDAEQSAPRRAPEAQLQDRRLDFECENQLWFEELPQQALQQAEAVLNQVDQAPIIEVTETGKERLDAKTFQTPGVRTLA